MRKKAQLQMAAAVLLLLICFSYFLYSFHFSHSVSSDPAETEQDFTVLIDAGHGGVDGGAVAGDGTEEKHINLQIALLLEQQLGAMGIRTAMTRTADESIHDSSAQTIREKKVSDIHNRMQLMEETENCIFVSIHQNKYSDSALSGTQVFYSPNTTASAQLAQTIQTSVRSLLQTENTREIEKSGSSIYLLYYARKPAVLVECGFLSNTAELEKLKEGTYQKQLAFCIAAGILEYLNI